MKKQKKSIILGTLFMLFGMIDFWRIVMPNNILGQIVGLSMVVLCFKNIYLEVDVKERDEEV